MTWQRVFNNPVPFRDSTGPADATEYWRRRSLPGVEVRRMMAGRSYDEFLSLLGRDIGSRHQTLTRGKVSSEYYLLPPMPARENPKASAGVEAAVKAWQMYYGTEGLPIKTQQRFYSRATKLTDKVATQHGMSSLAAHEQIQAEASRRGKIWPRPGKDY